MDDKCVENNTDNKINHNDDKNDEIHSSKMQNYTNQGPGGDAQHEDIINEIIVDKPFNIYHNSTTKLRAEAPPFTPTSKLNLENLKFQNVDDNIKQEYCFVNVDLVLPEDELKSDIKTSNIQEKYMNLNNKNIEEPFTQIEIEENAEELVPETILPMTTDQTAVVEIQRNPRQFLPRFFFDNKTESAGVVAAIFICIFLISYVLP
ncbi:uncharacterized protein LOC122860218 [Aphidius gifuensis]|uniref:uncharacterized protein LOC122860218 n=1 Tax=Aphidius gifuensis TaxID=684658 RepID=UPI001CDCD40C|nr:uncharacterized protein LOC122860218 [Aphidius gifuensis]